jgi:hypothetical protein
MEVRVLRFPPMKKLKRKLKHMTQLVTRGFSDEDLWNLDQTIANFVLPRLKAFKEFTHAYPQGMTVEEWNTTMDKMIWSFDFKVNHWYDDAMHTEENTEKYNEGMDLFRKYFDNLWD